MSATERRVLIAMIGAVVGTIVVGFLVVLRGWDGAAVGDIVGPPLGLLAALLVVRFAPVPRRGDDD